RRPDGPPRGAALPARARRRPPVLLRPGGPQRRGGLPRLAPRGGARRSGGEAPYLLGGGPRGDGSRLRRAAGVRLRPLLHAAAGGAGAVSRHRSRIFVRSEERRVGEV